MTASAKGKGKVYLVGAGPGDPGLITLKAIECLNKADTVVYDNLANETLLKYAPSEAELIYVGKKASDHTLSQSEINDLIVARAGQGRTVVRLKGGDPYIFGRGGEEAQALRRAGLPFEVVPGVTSAIAVPAYAGIPLTHRALTSTVGFITGHEDPTKSESSIDWDRIATGLGTLVFLMGVRNLSGIAAKLIKAGRDPATPAALIQKGTTPDQVTVTGTLADIAQKAEEKGLDPPAILVVGEVVSLAPELNWFESLPLLGRTVLVTRTRAQASSLVKALSGLGARVIECPTIQVVPPVTCEPLDDALRRLGDYDWLVLTSPNGVDFLMRRLYHLGYDARALAPVRLAAIGPATADKLAAYGLRADLLPEKYVAESLAEALIRQGIKGNSILLARAANARAVLPETLRAAGAEVHEVALYQTLPPEDLTAEAREALEQGAIDLVTFTSSSTVTNLVRLLGDGLEDFKARVKAACIGPITARTAREAGFEVAVEAGEYTIEGLVRAIEEYFS